MTTVCIDDTCSSCTCHDHVTGSQGAFVEASVGESGTVTEAGPEEGIINSGGERTVSAEDPLRDRPLDVERALAWAIRLAITHLLQHDYDEHHLSLSIELLKTIRDEPERIPFMFERWGLEPDEARSEDALAKVFG